MRHEWEDVYSRLVRRKRGVNKKEMGTREKSDRWHDPIGYV